VKTLLRLSLKKKTLVEGRTRSGQVFLRTIGHLFFGNFRRRLARVLVIIEYRYPDFAVGYIPPNLGKSKSEATAKHIRSHSLSDWSCVAEMCIDIGHKAWGYHVIFWASLH